MSTRKPLDEGCTGSLWCDVPGHRKADRFSGGRVRIYHVPLTAGQRKTLRERRHPEDME